MADTLSGIGSSRSSSPGAVSGAGQRRAAAARPAAPVEEQRETSYEPPQKHYVHVEGRRFDLSAPRGTYLNILI